MSARTGSAAPAGQALLGLAALLLLASPAAARGAISVSARVDRAEVALDEVLVLEVRVEADGEPQVSLPTRDFDFNVVSSAESAQTSVDLGGGGGLRIRRTAIFQFGLSPRREGALTIPPVTVRAGPATGQTVPIEVKVLPRGTRTAPPPPPQRGGGAFGANPLGSPFGGRIGPPGGGAGGGSRAWHGWEKDLVLQWELDRTEVFLGEQVSAAMVLLSPVGVVDVTGYQPPLYDGFWSEQLESPKQLTFEVQRVGGLPLRAYPIQKIALFPTRAGELELGSAQLSAVVRVGADDPFDPFPDVQRASRRSAPVKITVKPLPGGAPAGFDSVNTATATLSATLSDKAAAVGQPVTLRLTAQGEGNVKAWSLPAVPALPGLRAFAPTSSDKVAPHAGKMAGSRTVETVLVPERPGTLTVPPIRWPTFDPRAGKYRLLETAPLTLEVLPAGPTAPAAAAAMAGQNALGGGLRPIRSGGELSRRSGPPWQGWPFWLLLGAPVALFAALTGFDRLREAHAADGGARRLRLAGRLARRRLATAAKLLGGEAGPFHAEVERALTGYCADKLGRPAAGLTRDELHRALAEGGAHPPALRALAMALDACDAGRFGGAGGREEVLALAGRAMELLEEAHWRGAGGGA